MSSFMYVALDIFFMTFMPSSKQNAAAKFESRWCPHVILERAEVFAFFAGFFVKLRKKFSVNKLNRLISCYIKSRKILKSVFSGGSSTAVDTLAKSIGNQEGSSELGTCW